MSFGRNILLWTSQNEWMKKNIPKLFFVRKALKKFMPGEKIEDALVEAEKLKSIGVMTVLTKLGENISNLSDAQQTTNHYINVLDKIYKLDVSSEISLKLTQIGFDISIAAAEQNFDKILRAAKDKNNFVWIDMEQSGYTSKTIEFYKSFRDKYSHVGICLQAYLKRTKNDVTDLLNISPNIRLVKGAYMESPEIAFPQKNFVDKNYFRLSQMLLEYAGRNDARFAFATHDLKLMSKIMQYAEVQSVNRNKFEFQMLYGIKTSEQKRIAEEGYKIRVLISYGSAWYSWYMRRLAERPANVWFVLKNVISE